MAGSLFQAPTYSHPSFTRRLWAQAGEQGQALPHCGGRREGLTASAAGFFVTAVHAVSVRVAAPAQGDAVTALALELVHVTAGRAVFLWAREQHATQTWVPLVPAATPSSGFPAHLVRAIRTVVVPITFPAPGDAAAIGTGKLTLRAGPRGWERMRQVAGGWARALSPQGPLQPWAE